MAKIGEGIQVPLSWIPARDGKTPSGAINVCFGIYVIRRKYGNEWIPGKLVRDYRTCYCPVNGKELESREYEVLCDTSLPDSKKCYEWEHASGGDVPKNAIVAGTWSGTPLYIAKGILNREVCVGKVQEGSTCAYLPWGGKAHSVKDYEVLVLKME
uniref:DUF3421 domain-containing protein n=1 Tax=Trichobilharzia regenti TaxID=157069 RepID=A0AA85JSC8_TRIRE|nr:unnamed protein product [Trichobilharzia regenti]